MAKSKTVMEDGGPRVKKILKFVGDAPKPRLTFNGTLGLRAPFQLTIPPRAELTIDLGTQCDRFLSLLPHGKLTIVKDSLCVPNTHIHARVMNTSEEPVLLEVGDTVVEAVVLESSDFVAE